MSAPQVDQAPANLVSVLDDLARSEPDRIALSTGPTAAATGLPTDLSYRQLAEAVNRVAGALRGRGLEKGDRVVVLVPPSVELFVVLLAVLRLACTAVVVDRALGLRQMVACCERARPKAFVGTGAAHRLRLASSALRRIELAVAAHARRPVGGATLADLLAGPPDAGRPVAADDGTPALLGFTSGTTGTPKEVARTHGLLWAQHRALARGFTYEPQDRMLSALPLFALHDLAAGVSVVLPDRLGEQVVRQGVTLLRGAPPFYDSLVRSCTDRGVVLDGVRAAFVGGAAVGPRLLTGLARVLPSADVHVVYGSTEAEPIAAIAGEELRETAVATLRGAGICVGRPVVDAHVTLEPVLAGDGPPTGEVVVAGPHVVGGRAGTGDLAYFDDRGRLWLVGRKNSGPTHPLRIEPAVEALPFVSKAGLLHVAAPGGSGRTVLVVAARERSSPATRRRWRDELEQVCRTGGVPIDEVRFARTIPVERRHHAKVDLDRLTRWYARRQRWQPWR